MRWRTQRGAWRGLESWSGNPPGMGGDGHLSRDGLSKQRARWPIRNANIAYSPYTPYTMYIYTYTHIYIYTETSRKELCLQYRRISLHTHTESEASSSRLYARSEGNIRNFFLRKAKDGASDMPQVPFLILQSRDLL